MAQAGGLVSLLTRGGAAGLRGPERLLVFRLPVRVWVCAEVCNRLRCSLRAGSVFRKSLCGH